MKSYSKTRINCSLLFLVFLNLQNISAQTFQQDKFVIMSYGDPQIVNELYTSPSTLDIGHMNKLIFLRDAHFNLMSGFHIQRNNTTAANIYLLKLLDSINFNSTNKLKMLVRDSRFFYWDTNAVKSGGGYWQTPDTSVNNYNYNYNYACNYCNDSYQSIIARYLNLSPSVKENIYGFNLKDEPNPINCNDILAAQNLQKIENWICAFTSSFPDRLVYINLLAGYGFYISSLSCPYDYGTYLDQYINNPSGLNSHIGSIDHYPFLKGYTTNTYFLDLSVLRKHTDTKPCGYMFCHQNNQVMPNQLKGS